MVVGEDPLGELGEALVEAPESIEDGARGGVKRNGLMRGGERRVEVVAPQGLDSQPLAFELELLLENRRVTPDHVEQGLDRQIGDVVAQIAHGDG